jgi:DNA-binding transcriptional regulator YdaS (Cro superfamily)
MKVTEDFKESFLNMLEVLPNITAVCRLLGVSTKNLSKHRKADAEFEAEIKEAIERGYDMLEEEARRRAVDGVLKPVYYRGMKCGHIREYSDQLLVTLLKGYRPKRFNPGVKIEGGDGRKISMTFNIGGDE